MSIHLPPKRFRPRPHRRERRLVVDFACNDEHGAFRGRAVMAHFRREGGRHDDGCDLQHDDFVDGSSFRVVNGVARLHRGRFPIVATDEWCGNWCWNRYFFARADGLRLLRAMARSGAWSCDGGPARLCDWFEKLGSST